MSSGRKVRREGLGDPLEMGAERKRSLQWVVYYRAGGETEGLDASLAGMAFGKLLADKT